MRDIAIYGAGGFGREVACLLNKINEHEHIWNLIGFFDDGKIINSKNEYGIILGGINELNCWNSELNVVIAIANSHVVIDLIHKIKNEKVCFPNIIYGLSMADENNLTLGRGNIIGGGSHFSCNVRIGDFNVFNGFVMLGHDVTIGSFNMFMPASHVCGEVSIGERNSFGINSIVLQQVEIGSGVRLGPGSVLMHRPKDNSLYIGNPAKIFKY